MKIMKGMKKGKRLIEFVRFIGLIEFVGFVELWKCFTFNQFVTDKLISS